MNEDATQQEPKEERFSDTEIAQKLRKLRPGYISKHFHPWPDNFPATAIIRKEPYREGTHRHGLKELVKDARSIDEKKISKPAAHWYATLLRTCDKPISKTVMEKATEYMATLDQEPDPKREYYHSGKATKETIYAPLITDDANHGARMVRTARQVFLSGKDAGLDDKNGELAHGLKPENSSATQKKERRAAKRPIGNITRKGGTSKTVKATKKAANQSVRKKAAEITGEEKPTNGRNKHAGITEPTTYTTADIHQALFKVPMNERNQPYQLDKDLNPILYTIWHENPEKGAWHNPQGNIQYEIAKADYDAMQEERHQKGQETHMLVTASEYHNLLAEPDQIKLTL